MCDTASSVVSSSGGGAVYSRDYNPPLTDLVSCLPPDLRHLLGSYKTPETSSYSKQVRYLTYTLKSSLSTDKSHLAFPSTSKFVITTKSLVSLVFYYVLSIFNRFYHSKDKILIELQQIIHISLLDDYVTRTIDEFILLPYM